MRSGSGADPVAANTATREPDSLRIAVAFEQLALWSQKTKMCASCYVEPGTVECGPTAYCHVPYFMCARCAEHFGRVPERPKGAAC